MAAPPLPPEIAVTQIGTLVRYRLPRRRVPPRPMRLFPAPVMVAIFAGGIAGLNGAFFLYQFQRGEPVWPLAGVAIGFGLISLISWVVALVPLPLRATAQLDTGRVWFRNGPEEPGGARSVAPRAVRRFVVHPLADPRAEGPRGVVEVQLAQGPPAWFAGGYPLDWLTPLAADLAQHLKVEAVAASPAARPLTWPMLYALAAVKDEDVADVTERPPGSRGICCREVPGGQAWTMKVGGPGIAWGCGGCLFGFSALGTVAGCVRWWVPGIANAAWVALLTVLAALCVWQARQRIGRTITLEVQDGLLIRHVESRYRSPRVQSWARDEVAAIRTRTEPGGEDGPSVTVVSLFTTEGRRAVLCYIHDDRAGRWLATELRRALGVPAIGW